MASNPYYPLGTELAGYEQQILGMPLILAVFFAGAGVAATAGLAMTSGRLQGQQRALAIWLLISGLIHLIVEGTFALQRHFYRNADPTMYLLELWKLYANADSRYATADAFTVTMETFTAFVVGSACLASVHGLLAHAAWRWTVILILSTCQLYGTILYFATYWFDGGDFTRPEPIFFWFFFIFMNAIWLVLPAWAIWYSAAQSMRATATAEKVKRR